MNLQKLLQKIISSIPLLFSTVLILFSIGVVGCSTNFRFVSSTIGFRPPVFEQAAVNADMVVTASGSQTDGKIIVGGYQDHLGAFGEDFVLIRVDQDGNLDPTFGDNGKVVTHFGFGQDRLQGIAITPNDAIVAVGYAYNGTNLDVALARYTVDGLLDPSFGLGGITLTDLRPGHPNTADYGNAVKLQPDGRIVVAGETHANCQIVIARYTASGVLDPTFGTGGKGFRFSRFSGAHDTLADLDLMSDGRIVVAGTIANGRDYGVRRFLSNGDDDTTFGTNGNYILNMNTVDQTKSVFVRPDGKILVAGYSGTSARSSFILFQLTSTGVLDAGFGTAGIKEIVFGVAHDKLHDALLLADGSVVAVGQAQEGSRLKFAAARAGSAGAMFAGFGAGGKRSYLGLGATQEVAKSIHRVGDRLVITGNSNVQSDDLVLLLNVNLSGDL